MAKFQVGFNSVAEKVRVFADGQDTEGMDVLGSFDVSEVDASGPKFNKVLWHEVQTLVEQSGHRPKAMEITVTPEAYAQANGSFEPQDASTYGTNVNPNATSEQNPENSTQRDEVKVFAKRARKAQQDGVVLPQSEDTDTEAGSSEAPAGKA